MAGLTAAKAANIVDASVGTSALVAFSGAAHLRLITGTNSSATVAGTELATSGGYTAGTGITPVPFAAASVSTAIATNSSALTVTNMPATTVNAAEIWDSAGVPVRWWWGPLAAPKTTNAGDTLSFAVGAIQLQVASP